jgi:hypothetical protein
MAASEVSVPGCSAAAAAANPRTIANAGIRLLIVKIPVHPTYLLRALETIYRQRRNFV